MLAATTLNLGRGGWEEVDGAVIFSGDFLVFFRFLFTSVQGRSSSGSSSRSRFLLSRVVVAMSVRTKRQRRGGSERQCVRLR